MWLEKVTIPGDGAGTAIGRSGVTGLPAPTIYATVGSRWKAQNPSAAAFLQGLHRDAIRCSVNFQQDVTYSGPSRRAQACATGRPGALLDPPGGSPLLEGPGRAPGGVENGNYSTPSSSGSHLFPARSGTVRPQGRPLAARGGEGPRAFPRIVFAVPPPGGPAGEGLPSGPGVCAGPLPG